MKKAQKIKRSSQKPTILIAGGASFLGAALARRLFREKCLVVALDNLATGTRTHIRDLINRNDFIFINCDINEELPSAIQSVDYIFHLAAAEPHLKGPTPVSLNDLLTNSLGTRNLLELAKKSRAKFLLASSLTVYQGVLSHLELRHYFGLSEEEQKRYSHAEAKRFAEALVWEYFENYNLDVTIARLSHIYGPGMELASDVPLGPFLESLINNKNLVVQGEGLDKHYYTYLGDVVDGLVKTMFTPESRGKIFPLTDLKTYTSLELAQAVNRFAEPYCQVIQQPAEDRVELPDLKIIDGKNQEIINWKPQISLEEGLRRTLKEIAPAVAEKDLPVEPKAERAPIKKITIPLPPPKIPKIPSLKVRGRKLWLAPVCLLLTFLYFVLFPLLLTGYNLERGATQLKESEAALKHWDFETALVKNQSSQISFTRAKDSLKRLNFFAHKLGQGERLATATHTLEAANLVNQAFAHTISGLTPISDLLLTSLKSADKSATLEQTPISPQIFNTSLAEIISAKETLQLAEAELKQTEETNLPTFIRKRLGKEKGRLETAKETLADLEVVGKFLPELLGFQGQKKYLVLFQNSNELRPTGGFIGSYAQINFKDGKITELKIDDIYNPDGTLDERGIRIEPPEPIRKYLGQPNWYLRDANWAVSFKEAALDLKRLYTLETGIEVDGLFAVDLSLVQNILEVTGPVLIATYNEEVTSTNLFEKAELHSGGGYKEGAPYKKTFLTTLGQVILDKLASLEKEKYPKLAEMLHKSLEEKHLLLWFSYTDIKKLLAERGWDGAVKDTTGDYLYVVDANVGATKANFYVIRSINYEVAARDRQGVLEGKLTLTYVHTGTSDAWPGGPYKNYLRILTPKGTKLLRASRSSEGLEEKGVDIASMLEIGEESGKTTFATVFTLNHSQSVSLTFVYELPEYLSLTPKSSEYSLLIQKQPGTVGDSLIFSFSLPFGRSVAALPEGFEEIGDLLRYSGELKKDLAVIFTFD